MFGANPADHFANIGINGREMRLGVGISGRSADGNMRALITDCIKTLGPADINDFWQDPKLLCNPQAHIRSPRNDCCTGMLCV